MKSSPTYIISDVSFKLGRFKPIFNDCLILRESIHQIHESLQCSYFPSFISAVDFIHDTLEKIDCPFVFSLDSICADSSDSTDVQYVLLKAFVNVS